MNDLEIFHLLNVVTTEVDYIVVYPLYVHNSVYLMLHR